MIEETDLKEWQETPVCRMTKKTRSEVMTEILENSNSCQK